MRKRDFLARSAAAFAAMPQAGIAAKGSKRQLNLLFITVDDMNWSLPGFMGGTQDLTPNLDRLARRSHLFVNNRAAAPICQPSRQAMMCGLKPHHSGGIGFVPINEGIPTLTTVLREHGYFTSCIHKLEHMQPASCFPWDMKVPGKDRNPEVYDRALREAMSKAAEANRPFYINCNLNDPHRPFYGSPQAAELDHGEQGPYKVPREIKAEQVTVPVCLEDLPEVRKELAQYWNNAQRLDITIGRILQALDESGQRDSTVILFTSDHGMPFPFAKATCWDAGTRTPFLIAWPGMGTPSVFEDLTSNVDLLPTLLDILSMPKPRTLDGYSLLPRMEGRGGAQRRFVTTEVNTTVTGMAYPSRAVQDERYALVFSPWSDGKLELKVDGMLGLSYPAMSKAAKGNPALSRRLDEYVLGVPLGFYDLKLDPGQRNNLVKAPEHRDRIATMAQALVEEMKRTGDPQLDNVLALLAGKPTHVPQEPERWRSKAYGGSNDTIKR